MRRRAGEVACMASPRKSDGKKGESKAGDTSLKRPGKTQGAQAGPGAPLRQCVLEAVETYFADLNGTDCQGLYAMVIAEVEAPLLQSVMKHADGNQRLAAEMLGINRGTLRKKLREYDLVSK